MRRGGRFGKKKTSQEFVDGDATRHHLDGMSGIALSALMLEHWMTSCWSDSIDSMTLWEESKPTTLTLTTKIFWPPPRERDVKTFIGSSNSMPLLRQTMTTLE